MKPSSLSFQQMLLVAFLLIGALLGAAAVRALFSLESLMAQGREGADQAIALSTAAQSLGERSVAMERAARQSLVLRDRQLRQRFDEAARQAATTLDRLTANDLPDEFARPWREQIQAIGHLLDGPPETALDREREVARAFRELDGYTTLIAQQVQSLITQRNEALQARFETSRQQLAQQVLGSIGLAAALAVGFGVWLARPFQRLEKAIVALGENQLEAPIDIPGPTDVRRVSQQLDWLRLRLTELDADKARFLRHVSHELKTPLAALREGVALLQDGVAGPLSDNQREVARILHDNTATLQRRIEDLLQFNATAFAAQRLVRKPTEMGALVAGLVEEQQLQWRARGVQVQLRCLPEAAPEGGPLVADVDAALLGSAIANLLSNAIRYSPSGGQIHITLAQSGDGLFIDVADQGPGVPPEERERIFEPFFRGQQQPADGLPGTGIGLSIVAEAVAAHGGRVWLLGGTAAEPAGASAHTPGFARTGPPGAHFRIELPHALAD